LRKYVIERILGKHKTPWPLIWSEVSGYVAGFWGYYQSVQRLKVLGRSAPYVPLSQRPEEARLHPARQVQLAPEPPAVVEVQEPLKLNS
jgi:O-antigen biosynthesis protein